MNVIMLYTLRILGLILFYWIYKYFNKMFAFKITKNDLMRLKINNSPLVRFTSSREIIGDNRVRLIPKNHPEKNISTFCKPVIWMFVGEPSEKYLAENNITSYEYKITIPFQSLDANKMLYRKFDNVIGYRDVYEGQAEIEDGKTYKVKYSIRLKTYLKAFLELIIIISILLIIDYLYIASFMGLKLTFLPLTTLVIIVLILVILSRIVLPFFRWVRRLI